MNPVTLLNKMIWFFLSNKLVTGLVILVIFLLGISFAPFDWKSEYMPRSPIAVDAIPDIGENQQIVFTSWMGRSPQDIEDQITYPLTASLMGIPGVKTIRSYSYFGFSSIYIIFKEDIEFYWSRTRILEKINSLPANTLPQGVTPNMGPDATALGQIFWYTLEGLDPKGNPTGGWNQEELRTIQDYYVKYALQSVEGVSEVASVGGFVKEYQIDIDPDKLRLYNIPLEMVYKAAKDANIDIGARTVEINRVEYLIRGKGYIKNIDDLKNTVLTHRKNIPITLEQIAEVHIGPSPRRGILDKGGAETVGGVVVVRYGENPLATIKRVEEKIKEISPGFPQKALADGTVSKVQLVPFYNRTGLIYETLGTLSNALTEEIIITCIVIFFMLANIRSSLLISLTLPLAVLMTFIFMKAFEIDANIVALSGIAIAIGTMVDMGIIICENIVKHLKDAHPDEDRIDVIYRAVTEISGALLTAVMTTLISFLPVFTMVAAEGKLFKPLAYTKTFSITSALFLSLIFIPPAAHLVFRKARLLKKIPKEVTQLFFLACAISLFVAGYTIPGVIILASTLMGIFNKNMPPIIQDNQEQIHLMGIILVITSFLSRHWMPLGLEYAYVTNFIFVALLLFSLLYFFKLFIAYYPTFLHWSITHKKLFILLPIVVMALGYFGFSNSKKEFMPNLDEGSFLLMPTTMAHAGITETSEQLSLIDQLLENIPEIDQAVGKLGRAESPLDPAPISMYETVINYKSEYKSDKYGNRLRYAYNRDTKEFIRNNDGDLIEDTSGKPFRQWRSHIKSPDDIWKEITDVIKIPGMTSAPKLQPISARLVMLQSGMRAPMGIKIKGPDLETIETFGIQLEALLKNAPGVSKPTVIADRLVGKPYLEIEIDRTKIARYGISIAKVQQVIATAIGGKEVTYTIEGRKRFPVRIRYMRELRDNIESIYKILVASPDGTQIPLAQLAKIKYTKGPMVIKSENSFLVSYVLFDKERGQAETDVVESAQTFLQEKIDSGELIIPAGVSYTFAGNYENQVRSNKTLMVVVPIALVIILLILYFQFKSVGTALIIFSGILIAWAGGFILIWLYSTDWFMNITILDVNIRTLFQIREINLSVAVWVGFIALFGIASDNGVVICQYIRQSLEKDKPTSIHDIRRIIIQAGIRRIRPCLMTTATTILALLPVLTSTGRGADIMLPMSIPSVGGMLVVLLSVFVVPVLYSLKEEYKFNRQKILS